MGTCSFDSCSGQCLKRWDPNLSKGDKLFAMNVQGYLKKGEPWSIGKTKEPKQILEYPQRYLAQYPDIFSEEEFDKLPPRRPWDHCIELNADFKPVNCKIYALTLDEQKALDVFLEENL